MRARRRAIQETVADCRLHPRRKVLMVRLCAPANYIPSLCCAHTHTRAVRQAPAGSTAKLHLLSCHDTTLMPMLLALGVFDGEWCVPRTHAHAPPRAGT